MQNEKDEEVQRAKQQALQELSELSGIEVSELESSANFNEAAYRVIKLLREQLDAKGKQ
jgi:hypothetical protein